MVGTVAILQPARKGRWGPNGDVCCAQASGPLRFLSPADRREEKQHSAVNCPDRGQTPVINNDMTGAIPAIVAFMLMNSGTNVRRTFSQCVIIPTVELPFSLELRSFGAGLIARFSPPLRADDVAKLRV